MKFEILEKDSMAPSAVQLLIFHGRDAVFLGKSPIKRGIVGKTPGQGNILNRLRASERIFAGLQAML